MTHRVGKRKLGLPSDQRRALLNGLVRALFQHDKILTTETRAKEVRSLAERLITAGKGPAITAQRQLRRTLVGHTAAQPKRRVKGLDADQLARRTLITGESLVKRVMDDVLPRYKDKQGGYTRITRVGRRRGDAAMVVELALLD